jgi:hypothetical protein
VDRNGLILNFKMSTIDAREVLGVTAEMEQSMERFWQEKVSSVITRNRGRKWNEQTFQKVVLDQLPKESWTEEQKKGLMKMFQYASIVCKYSIFALPDF